MASGDSSITHRAWDVVRLTLLWPRRGGTFRWLLAVKFHLAVVGFIKSIGGGCGYHSSMPICYGERELSFDNTLVSTSRCIDPNHP
ncbi:hypothetical protein ACJRO7_014304 [Eucalyptus globulus]|uniref:Uncharacterized protein n=1 Tax=Eucalyptus globulus TaxID=34317 RepID=A0ABD3L0U5_EUCGL